jgi:hypothetical protein
MVVSLAVDGIINVYAVKFRGLAFIKIPIGGTILAPLVGIAEVEMLLDGARQQNLSFNQTPLMSLFLFLSQQSKSQEWNTMHPLGWAYS